MNNRVITVENLTKRFGNFTAVDSISFHVEHGEIFGFLGANGAGKTTAMRMLCGLSIPSAGKGMVAGCDIASQQERIKKRIGYMSQRFSLYESLSVFENLKLFATIYGMTSTEIRQESDRLFQMLEMENLRNVKVKALPTGWKQKLAFAIAIIHRPEILFLDEPTGGVDPLARRRFWELIYQVASEGMTVFVTTHYLEEAEYCNRVSIMVDGRIAALDSPQALKLKFNADSMDAVFRIVAEGSTRNAD